MRAVLKARWAACALAMAICAPALADRARRALAECTRFEQVDKDEPVVAFTIHNTCSIPVDCSLAWRVVCAPDSNKRRASHLGAASFTITEGGAQSTDASAAVCGDAGWLIDSVRWRCEPRKS